MSNPFSKRQMGGQGSLFQGEMERAFSRLRLVGGSVDYTPADTSLWAGEAPTTVQEALDRIALHIQSGAGAAPIVELP